MLTNKMFLAISAASLVTGCALTVPESVTNKVISQALPTVGGGSVSDGTFVNNDVDNLLTITRVTAWPAVVATESSSLLSVDYSDAVGRPVGVTWECSSGVLLSDKGAKTVWYPPNKPGSVCDCEVTVRSRSGAVRATVRLMVETPKPTPPRNDSFSFYVK